MNIQHKNIRYYALMCGVFFSGALLFCKGGKNTESVKSSQSVGKYTVNPDGRINSVVDYNFDTLSIESAVPEPDVDFKHTDDVQYNGIDIKNTGIDVEMKPQINYLGDSVKYTNYSVKSKGRKLTYLRNDTVLFVRENGTLPWRNNNPGALKYTEFTRKYGAIGRGSRNFAVFPTKEAGMVALKALLQSDSYKTLKLGRAIEIFAPDTENNTEAYKRKMRMLTGVRLTKKLYELNNDEFESVVTAIVRLEGSIPGKETIFVSDIDNKITDTIIRNQYIKNL